MLSVLEFAHLLVEERLAAGDAAVDATTGKGTDTLFLARCVGEQGRVFAFDIQQAALEHTRQRLQSEFIGEGRVSLLHCSHDQMLNKLPAELHGRVGAVVFNLGYLPGGDHSVVTRPESTLAAVRCALSLLRRGGILTAVVYTGHAGGAEEAMALADWAAHLPQRDFQVVSYRYLNQQNHPPYMIAVEKR